MSAAGLAGAAVPAPRERGLPRAFPSWFSPLWIVFVTWQWWMEIRHQLAAAIPDGGPRLPADAAAAFAAFGHLAANGVEALFYVWWWRARGVRLGFVRLFEWLVSISLLDLLASGLTRVAASHPGWPAHAIAVLAGIGVLRGEPAGWSPGLRAAVGSVGLLCLARLLATATLQRRGVGGGLVPPLRLTLAAWLITRVVIWWVTDLARGMSPLP